MNCPANTTVVTRHLLALATNCSYDWKLARCPLLSMFDLIESGARFVLIGIASAVLAIAGFILSVLAHAKEVTTGRSSPKITPLTSPPRKRDSGVPSVRISRPPHDSSDRSIKRRDLSRGRRLSTRVHAQSPTTSPNSSLAAEAPSPSEKRQQRPMLRICQASPDAATRASPPRTKPSEATPTLPHHGPTRAFTDVSSNQSSEGSTESSVFEDHLPTGLHVLKKIKERHNHLRERCLVRAQSMPVSKPTSRPARRTDPYQAPYFFPTPMSPAAGTYLQEVVKERHREYPQPIAESPTPDATPNALAPSAIKEEPTQPTPPPSPKAEHRQRRHRWSWHMPHLPLHPQSDGRARSVEGARQEKGVASGEHKEILSKFKFGHHRRRNGTGSDDVRLTGSPKAA